MRERERICRFVSFVVLSLFFFPSPYTSSSRHIFLASLLTICTFDSSLTQIILTSSCFSTLAGTLTQLIVSFTHLAPTNDGALKAIVTVQSTYTSGNDISNAIQVADVRSAIPYVDENTVLNLKSDTALLTFMGTGFDATNTSANTHIFTQSTGESVKGLPALKKSSTMTSVVVTFTHLAPTNEGNLMSQVVVSQTWSTPSENKTIICTIVAEDPTVSVDNTLELSSDARKLTIKGKGFDATSTTMNVLLFGENQGETVHALTKTSTFR